MRPGKAAQYGTLVKVEYTMQIFAYINIYINTNIYVYYDSNDKFHFRVLNLRVWVTSINSTKIYIYIYVHICVTLIITFVFLLVAAAHASRERTLQKTVDQIMLTFYGRLKDGQMMFAEDKTRWRVSAPMRLTLG